jgi:hypothetical protein
MNYQLLECLGTALIGLIAAGGWLYRKLKSSPPQPPGGQSPATAPPAIPTPMRSAKPQWMLLSLASAIAAFVAVNGASLAVALWISLRPGMPPDIGEGMGYVGGLFICIAGPVISLIAGTLSAVAHRLAKEFQSRELPLIAHIALGGAVGLVLTLIPAAFLVADTCTAEFPC